MKNARMVMLINTLRNKGADVFPLESPLKISEHAKKKETKTRESTPTEKIANVLIPIIIPT
jgi:hypothetical protein